MDIIYQLRRKMIGNFSLNQLKDILNGRDNDFRIKSTIAENIFISERDSKNEIRSISCINKYYLKAGENKPFTAPKINNKCDAIKRHYGTNVSCYQCITCHLNMIEKENKKEVFLK